MASLDMLVEMGFSQAKVEKAMSMNNNNPEQAMEWLLAHAEDIEVPVPVPVVVPTVAETDAPVFKVPDTPKKTDVAEKDDAGPSTIPEISSEISGETPETNTESEVKSIQCNECNRLFKTQLEVEFHASKSGHKDFSETTEEKKPLTEEEKKAQLAKLEEKMKQKRIEREEKEKREASERERIRIKSGKDMTEVRRKMEEEEMKKIVEQRKREKLEEKVARDRVRAQIEFDKETRRKKLQGTTSPDTTEQPIASVSTTTSPQSTQVSPDTTDYKTTKIQIRLPNGDILQETFDKHEQLAAVRLFVQLKQEDLITTPFGMMTNFPRKVFQNDDYQMPLEQLGLVPSAVIIVTRHNPTV